MPHRFLPALMVISALLPAGSAGAAESIPLRFTEDFSTREFCDRPLTTADWDTVARSVGLLLSNPTAVVAQWDSPGQPQGIAVDGRFAYLCDNANGLHVLDVSDPAAPVLLGTVPALNYAYDADPEGVNVYLAEGSTGLRTVDIQNPAAPVVVGVYNTPGIAYAVDVDGDMAYVADGSGGLRVIDVSMPRTPSLEGYLATSGQARDVDVVGDYAYVAAYNAGLVVIDVSDPRTPALVGTCDTEGLAYGVTVAGHYAYVADGVNGLVVVDVANPASPRVKANLDTPGTAWKTAVTGDRLYLADSVAGLVTIGIGDPEDPGLIVATNPPRIARAVALSGTHALVADNGYGLVVVSVAATQTPQQAAAPTAHDPRTVATWGDLAVVTGAYEGVDLFDISDPAAPVLASSMFLDTDGRTMDAVIVGDLVYLTAGTANVAKPFLAVIDAADPAAPTLLGQLSGFEYGYGVAVSGDYAYVGAGEGLKVVDISDPAHPAVVHTLTLSYKPYDICIHGNLALLADVYTGLVIVDISNPRAAAVIGTLNTVGSTTSVAAEGNYAYISDSIPDAIMVVDISAPSAPVLVGTLSGRSGVQFDLEGNLLFASSQYSGASVIDVSDPAAPTLAATLPAAWAMGVQRHGDHVLVGDNDAASTKLLRSYRLFASAGYADSGLARSLALNPEGTTIKQWRVTAATNGHVQLGVSLDGGTSFADATSGAWTYAAAPGSALRWRSVHDSKGGAHSAVCTALQLDWRAPAAHIDDVSDIPGDQGGRVRLRFTRAADDFAAQTTDPVTGYTVWRRLDDKALAAALAAAPAAAIAPPAACGDLPLRESDGRLFTLGQADGAKAMPAGVWEVMGSFLPTQQEQYVFPAATLADSGATIPWAVYCVTAHTAKPALWYASAPDSGWSVDNLAPAVPQGLHRAPGDLLAWQPSPDVDFQYFSVFGSAVDHLDGAETLIGHTVGTSVPVGGLTHAHFLVTATDCHGNRSDAAVLDALSGAPLPVPTVARLYPCRPNPFNPRTTIRFDVPVDGPVRLAVYDVAGRLVRALAAGTMTAGRHEAVWDGRDGAGREVGSGSYLARLQCGDIVQTIRMALVR